MGKQLFISVSLACILFAALPMLLAGTEVIENKCTEEQSREKDRSCAHKFLEKITQPSANCSAELRKYHECFKNFTLDSCFRDYLQARPDMRQAIGRMAGIKSQLHRFGRMMCGILNDGPINTTGLPDKVRDMLKCKPEYFDKAKDCAKAFYDKYIANRNSTNLCKSYMEAKMCNGALMKQHCTFERLPPIDRFNPFCPNKQDPPHPKGGAEKAYTSGILTSMGLALYLIF